VVAVQVHGDVDVDDVAIEQDPLGGGGVLCVGLVDVRECMSSKFC